MTFKRIKGRNKLHYIICTCIDGSLYKCELTFKNLLEFSYLSSSLQKITPTTPWIILTLRFLELNASVNTFLILLSGSLRLLDR